MGKPWIAALAAAIALCGTAAAADWAEFETSELRCVIGNNAERGAHRAGYNGVFELVSVHQPETLFVPAYAGLNLEHYFHNGLNLDNRTEFFEPRNAPMTFEKTGERTARLRQEATPFTGMMSVTTFTLGDPHSIDMEYVCVPTDERFEGEPFGVFWASYINAPHDKSMYFLREGTADGPHMWQQHCTQYHDHDSTAVFADDPFEWIFPEALRGRSLFSSISRVRYSEPFYYGRFRNMVWIVMFGKGEGVRFAHSPSGGGAAPAGNDTCPAWDFQFVVPGARVGEPHRLRCRAVYKLWEGRADVLEEYRRFRETVEAD